MNEIIKSESSVTMSSMELVAFINSQRDAHESELRHAHFMEKVTKVLGEEREPNFRSTYQIPGPNGSSRSSPCYNFPKREACLMAMSYSYDLQAKVFDRMTELEKKVSVSALPDFSNPVIAAREWANQFEAKVIAQNQIEAQRPAVEFVDRFVDAKGSKCLSDVAKLLKWKPRSFIAQLAADGIIFKRNECWVPVQRYLDAGYFSVHTGEAQNHTYYQTRVESRGEFWLATKYGMDRVQQTKMIQ